VPFLIGFTGLSGAGKTTAVEYLSGLGRGQGVYLGQAVHKEIAARGLSTSAETERQVRLDLRKESGAGALAKLVAPEVRGLLESGCTVLLDSIFHVQEYLELQQCGGYRQLLVAIEACIDTRAQRLRSRPIRPLTRAELEARDQLEINVLGTQSVIESATCRIANEGSLDNFIGSLDTFWTSL
jgi:dephospho-CoA kinase